MGESTSQGEIDMEELPEYYKHKQRGSEEMAEYLFWMVVIFAVLAMIWGGYEIAKFLMAI